MEEKKIILPCIAVAAGDIHPRVITCGDPRRAEKISRLLDNPVCLAQNREFWVYNGHYKGVGVSVISHGVGCGGAVIAFESMVRAGAKSIIRVGTCGGMQDEVVAGSNIISTGVCRDDGMTEKIVPLSYPAVADAELLLAMKQAAKELDYKVFSGITLTQGHFYLGIVESNVKRYASIGVLATENELSGLFVVCNMHGIRGGGILTADAKAFELETVESYQPDEAELGRAVDRAIRIALEAIIRVEV